MDPISQQAFVAAGGAGASGATYVDDVFSTFLYEGTNSTNAINNGIDLSGEGGLVWIKGRDNTEFHRLFDTARGDNKQLSTNSNTGQGNQNHFSSFNSNGFTVTTNDNSVNNSSYDYVSWSFRKCPGFFDVVTYTGNSDISKTVSHSLGSVPGVIIVKKTSGSGGWYTWHRDLGGTGKALELNSDAGTDTNSNLFSTLPTATVFSPGDNSHTNQYGQSYVAYLFAHDDQSFGTNEDEAIIKCGSYTGTGSSGNTVNLGFEPQWMLIKQTNTSRNWVLVDNMRGVPVGSSTAYLQPNVNNAENTGAGNIIDFTATGFELKNHSALVNGSSGSYAYVAIRRPHKPPEAGTDVFKSVLQTSHPQAISVGFPTDLAYTKHNTQTAHNYWISRLTGKTLISDVTNAEGSQTSFQFDLQNSFSSGTWWGSSTNPVINYYFKRAPGFFDVATYTGSNSSGSTSYTHNLKAVPELMIIKVRNYGGLWYVWSPVVGNSKFLRLNGNEAESTGTSWTTPTATQFTAFSGINATHENYQVFLFASLDGISKVGTYSGTGNNIDVDCGFTAGARFVMIKRTDSTGAWYVWDTTRGIVSGNDSYLRFNVSNPPVTTTDYIDPLNSGFTVTSSAVAGINASGGTYIFLAIA